MSISIELIGGSADGRVMVVPDEFLHRPLMVPVPPSLSVTLSLAQAPADALLLPRPLQYEWDGTVREHGVRRFRLR